VRWLAITGGLVALVLSVLTGTGAPRCGGRPMGPDDWCARQGAVPATISYTEKADQLDDVSRAYLGLAGIFGGTGLLAVVAHGRRRRARAAADVRARVGPDDRVLAAAGAAGLGAAVVSGVGRSRGRARHPLVVHLLERGVVVEAGTTVTTVAWDDLVAVYEALGERGAHAPVAFCRLVTTGGAVDLRAVPGDGTVPAVAEAAAAALATRLRVPLTRALADGRSLLFGPLALDAVALYRAGRRPTVVPWDRVVAVERQVRVVQGAASSRLGVTYADAHRPGRRRRFSVDLAAVPNARLLLDLAEDVRARVAVS